MSIKLRTISQLQKIQDIDNDTLFGVSQPIAIDDNGNTAYMSNSVSYETIRQSIEDAVKKSIVDTYHLSYDAGTPINIAELQRAVHKLSAEDCNIYGEKTFMQVPKVADSIDYTGDLTVADNMLPTVQYVKKLLHNTGDYITDDLIVVGAPGNNARYTVFDRNFMHWKIGENQKDSSEYVDTTGYPVGPKVCTHTGNLVIYGWLADNGDVEPQDAWVGLYGCLHTNADKENERDWVLLQLQPWPLTAKSSVFQYVGFNVKVAKGLMLKIKTGFRVKGKNSGFQGGSTLTYWTNQPNSFVGYFITTADEYNAV